MWWESGCGSVLWEKCDGIGVVWKVCWKGMWGGFDGRGV